MDRLTRQLQTFVLLMSDAEARAEGVPLAELAQLLGVEKRRVASFIARIKDVGDPLGTPDAFVDIELDADRVKVYFAPHPAGGAIRFSPTEMLALLFLLSQVEQTEATEVEEDPIAGVTTAAEQGGRSKTSSVEASTLGVRAARLHQQLLQLASRGAQEQASVQRIIVETEGGPRPRFFSLLEQAMAKRTVVEMRYYSASKDRLQDIRLKPCALVQHQGLWYVVTDNDFRFRLDRIREAVLGEAHFEIPASLDLSRYQTDSFFEGKTPTEVTLKRSDGTHYTVPTGSATQLLVWVRTLQGELEVVGPPAVRQAHLEALRERLALYSEPS